MGKVVKEQKRNTHPCNTNSPHVLPPNVSMWQLLVYEKGDEPYLPKQHYPLNVSNQESLKDTIRKLADKLCEEYPLISTYEGVFGGQPHLKETRFRVSDVLSAFCIYPSVEEIIDNLENRYNEEQLKSALRFARDFLDACYALPEFE